MVSSTSLRLPATLTTLVLLLLLGGCDIGGAGSSDVTLSGRVLNAATQNPVAEAVLTIQYEDDGEQQETSVVTDESGRFSTSIEISNSTQVTIEASKRGQTVQVTERVAPDLNTVDDIELALNFGEDDDTEPGRPTNITLAEQSTDVIRVQESGGEEVARLTFQVVDSTGTPIGLDRSVDVDFRFSQQPGDATLTPESESTDGNGTATVNVASGKTAGIVQVVAEAEKAGGAVCHIARDDRRLAPMRDALAIFAPDMPVFVFPGWDCLPYDRPSPNADGSAGRMAVLAGLVAGGPKQSTMRIIGPCPFRAAH